ncbi:MAG: putative bifunctional diguanylate cyclase/phosphodiesterase [Pseudomonadota bacterium]
MKGEAQRQGAEAGADRRSGRGAAAARLLAVLGLVASLALAADALIDWASARSLETYAIHLARNWADRAEAGQAGAPRPAGTRRTRDVLDQRLFGPRGVPLAGATGRGAIDPGPALPEGWPGAWARLTEGRPHVKLLHDPRRSARTEAQVFLPLPEGRADGARFARLRMDLSDLSGPVTRVLAQAGLAMAALAGAAVLGPALGWLALRGRARRAEDAAREAAHADLLTGLANRAGFDLEAGTLAERTARAGGWVAAISLDLDRFRALNDQHGAAAGDAALRRAAEALRGALRGDDVVGRLGGDEFAALVHLSRPEDLGGVLEMLRRRLSGPAMAEGRRLEVSASLGGFVMDPRRVSLTSGLRRAEIALAEARAEGGGRARLFQPAMEDRLHRGRRIERSLREGMKAGRFWMAYQPLVSRRSGRVRGFEALMRLSDPDGRPVAPGDFIPVAEKTGLIRELGAWALREAAGAAMRWPEPLRVSVNLSAAQFRDGALVEAVTSALSAAGLPPARLELEITESLLIADPEEAGRQLAELRRLGVSVAMDDFGAGYSSLAYLWRFRFDRLKLDRSFAQALSAESARAQDMIAAIVALGHRLGMRVTAEGIETSAQARLFGRLGCDDFQGFHFGFPAAERELAEIMRWARDAQAEREAARGPAAPGPRSRTG